MTTASFPLSSSHRAAAAAAEASPPSLKLLPVAAFLAPPFPVVAWHVRLQPRSHRREDPAADVQIQTPTDLLPLPSGRQDLARCSQAVPPPVAASLPAVTSSRRSPRTGLRG